VIDAASDLKARTAPGTGRFGSGRAARTGDTLIALTGSDLRARYGRGPWKLVKWLLDPFAAVGIYLLLVTVVLDRAGTAPGLSLACAVVPFQLLMMALVNSMGAVSLRRSIILNMRFDRGLIPVSSVLTESVAFASSFVLIVMMMAIYRVPPTPALLWLPLVLAVTLLLSVALAYPGAIFGLWFSELRVFAISFVRTLFFVSAGLVPLALISGRASDLIRLNPLTGLFESYRDLFLYGRRPAAWELLVPAGFAIVLLLLSVPVYRRDQGQFAKVL
jgi:ABC-type polysaccharide/polyol phosphate export permease